MLVSYLSATGAWCEARSSLRAGFVGRLGRATTTAGPVVTPHPMEMRVAVTTLSVAAIALTVVSGGDPGWDAAGGGGRELVAPRKNGMATEEKVNAAQAGGPIPRVDSCRKGSYLTQP